MKPVTARSRSRAPGRPAWRRRSRHLPSAVVLVTKQAMRRKYSCRSDDSIYQKADLKPSLDEGVRENPTTISEICHKSETTHDAHRCRSIR
jgi:hypothetical protein